MIKKLSIPKLKKLLHLFWKKRFLYLGVNQKSLNQTNKQTRKQNKKTPLNLKNFLYFSKNNFYIWCSSLEFPWSKFSLSKSSEEISTIPVINLDVFFSWSTYALFSKKTWEPSLVFSYFENLCWTFIIRFHFSF